MSAKLTVKLSSSDLNHGGGGLQKDLAVSAYWQYLFKYFFGTGRSLASNVVRLPFGGCRHASRAAVEFACCCPVVAVFGFMHRLLVCRCRVVTIQGCVLVCTV